jgi:hypothetical protein
VNIRRSLLLTVALAMLVCVAFYSLNRTMPMPRPVSVSFIGFSNYQSEVYAVFEATNHLSSDVTFDLNVDGIKDGHSQSMLAAGYSPLPPHTLARETLTLNETTTNKWKFVGITQVSRWRPRWQRSIISSLDRLKIRPGFLSSTLIHPPVTNVWNP